MLHRNLGRSDIRVPSICIGGNVFGWTADSETSFAILDHLYDAGLRFIDTADAYSIFVPGHIGGESETVIGEWLKLRGHRGDLIIASKVGAELAPDRKGLSRAYIMRAVEDSLRRLQTDYIDIYQSHRDDHATPVEETLSAYDALIKAGKVRIIGASNYPSKRLEESMDMSQQLGLPRYEVVQPHYNLYDREGFERDNQLFCIENQVSAICYYGLAHGFLTGKYRSVEDIAGRPRSAPLRAYFTPRGMAILKALDDISSARDAKPAHVALAWLARQPGVASAIASVTSLDQAADLVKAARLDLTAEELAKLEKASAPA